MPPGQPTDEGEGGDYEQGQAEPSFTFQKGDRAGDVEQDGIDDEESVKVHARQFAARDEANRLRPR